MKLSGTTLILIACLVACLFVLPVSAETLTGTLGGNVWNSTNYDVSGSGTIYSPLTHLQFNDIEKTEGFISLIYFNTEIHLMSFPLDRSHPEGTQDPNAPTGAQTSITFRQSNGTIVGGVATQTDGAIIGSGTIGYQRRFDSAYPPNEIYGGYIYVITDSWNITGLSGDAYVYLDYNAKSIYNATPVESSEGGAPATGVYSGAAQFRFGNAGGFGGAHTINIADSAYVYYSVEKPSGLGITGTVNRTNGVEGVLLYPSRVYISDINHKTITNDNLFTTIPFYFSTNYSQIYVSVLSPGYHWYNSSLLFTEGGITPTPTPTPTVTAPVSGSFNLTVYVKDNFNNTPLANTYVELHRNDAGDSTNAGYTNASGIVQFLESPYPTYASGYSNEELRFWKTGYAYGSATFNPYVMDPNFDIIMALNPSISATPATVNITVHAVDASNGNANLANALVKIYPNYPQANGTINWDYYLSGLTNSSGLATFQNVPASAYNEIITSKTLYSTDSYAIGAVPLTDFSHTAYLTTTGVTPTPTSLPVSGNYTLTLSTHAVQVYGNVTATIASAADPTLADITGITYWYSDDLSVETDFYEAGSTNLQKAYWLTAGTWYEFDQNTQDYTEALGGIPNPDSLQFRGSVGTKTLHCTIFTASGPFYDLTDTVVVGAGQSYVSTLFYAIDGDSGAQIQGCEIDIYTKSTKTWLNGTYATGQVYISSPPNTLFDAYGHLAGYIDPAMKLNVSSGTGGNMYRIPFYLGETPPAGNQTFHFTVTDEYDQPLAGATVAVRESGNTTATLQTTTSGGLATFTLKQSTLYTYVVSKTGYTSVSGSRTTSTASADSVIVTLRSVAVTTTATPTPTPTIIPTEAGGNYTGFWGPVANSLAAAGALPTEIGILMASLLIFIGVIVGGWGNAPYSPSPVFNLLGAEVGGVFGFVLSCGFGFIPLVWVIAIIMIGVFLFIFFPRG